MSVCLSSFKPKSTTERSCLKTRHCARDMWMTGDCRVSPFCSNVSNMLSTLQAMACIKTARDKENVLFGPALGNYSGQICFKSLRQKTYVWRRFCPFVLKYLTYTYHGLCPKLRYSQHMFSFASAFWGYIRLRHVSKLGQHRSMSRDCCLSAQNLQIHSMLLGSQLSSKGRMGS